MAPPTSQKSKFCTSCNQLIPHSSFGKHMKEFHEKVHQQFQCPHPQCTQTFAKQSFLNFHVEKHIPKSQWVWFCRLCAQPFPSEARLKSHELSSHQNDAFYCRHCDLEGIVFVSIFQFFLFCDFCAFQFFQFFFLFFPIFWSFFFILRVLCFPFLTAISFAIAVLEVGHVQ